MNEEAKAKKKKKKKKKKKSERETRKVGGQNSAPTLKLS